MNSRVNQTALRRIRLERGYAVRELARDCGLEIATLNRLETSTDPTLSTISLAAFLRLADYLDVSPAALLETPTPPPTQPTPDTAQLAALLHTLGVKVPLIAIAEALNWTLPKTHDTANDLDTLLRPLGLAIHKNSGLISVRATTSNPDAEAVVRRHPRTPHSQRVQTPARARLLYEATQQPLSMHSISQATRINIAVLLNLGLLTENTDRHLIPTADVTNSLYPEGSTE